MKKGEVMTTSNTIKDNCPPEIIENPKVIKKIVKIPRGKK